MIIEQKCDMSNLYFTAQNINLGHERIEVNLNTIILSQNNAKLTFLV